MTTHYILLTATKIIQPDPTRPGMMVQATLSQKQKRLMPASVMLSEDQATGATVAEMGTHAIIFEESFEDVMLALAPVQIPSRNPYAGQLSSQRSAYAAERAASGARHQGELSAEEELGQILQEAKEKLETVRHANGDLRLNCSATGERPWFVQIRRMDEDRTFEWTRTGLPAELTAGFPSAEAASEAVKLAGYGRRLIDE